MRSVLRWLSQGIGLHGRVRAVPDNDAAFERIDSARLAANEFHASASMGLREAAGADFAETLPAYTLSLPHHGAPGRGGMFRPRATAGRSLNAFNTRVTLPNSAMPTRSAAP